MSTAAFNAAAAVRFAADYQAAAVYLGLRVGTRGDELAQAYGSFGLILMAAEYLDAAVSSLRNAQTLAPNDPRWPYYLGQFYVTRGEHAKASESFARALELNPADVPTLVWLGETYLDQGRSDDARRLFALRHVPAGMALYQFPTLGEQASKWLGGGKNSVAAKALAATAEFQLSQKQIEKTLPDYSVVVNPTYAQDAAK